MKMLSSDVKKLLDKLYNLRGEDSVILTKMNRERQDAIETQERTKNEKTVLLDKIDKLTKEEETLAKEGKNLTNVLSNIDRNNYATVLERLNIDFDPEGIKTKIDTMLPDTISKVSVEHKKATEELENVEKEMNNAITKVEELGIRKDEALGNQAKLNEYFELALDGNINITRDAITSLLQKFDFTEDEQREAAKILMFPEDALYEYDASVKSTPAAGRTIADVIVEAKKESKEVQPKPVSREEMAAIKASSEGSSELENIFEKVIEENVIPVAEEVSEEPTTNEVTNQTVIDLLQSLGVETKGIKEFDKVVANYDKELITNNVGILKDKKVDLGIIKDNTSLLYDKELKEKIEKLLTVGKEAHDISLMPNVLVKYDLNGLNKTIDLLKTSGLDPKKVPLMAY